MVKYLSIGPGAMAYFTYLGKVSRLKDEGKLDELAEIAGASAGGLLGAMYCLCKGDTKRIMEISIAINVKNLMNISFKNLTKSFGLVSLKPFKKVLVDTCRLETDKSDITFRELYERYPVRLHIASYCVQLENTKYFSVDTTPDMSVLDAVCASIAVPFLFSSVTLEDGLNYIDGGYMELVPGGPFLGFDDVLCLRILWGSMAEAKDIKTYAFSLLLANMKLRHVYNFPTHSLTCEDAFNFNATSELKMRMYLSGYAQEFSP